MEASLAPEWFEGAVSAPRETGETIVDGVAIAWHAWGRPTDDLILLVHGGGAHAAWWHAVGPLLATDHRVVAMDLSGHGDSAPAADYSFGRWAQEVRAVALAQSDRPAFVVGHSMGGLVALTAAGQFGEDFAAVIGIDIPEEAVRNRHIPRPEERPERPALSTKDEILARFRTQPPDSARKPYLVEYVGNHSVRRQPHGWTWKFDHGVYFHGHFERRHLALAKCEVSLIVAERSLLTDAEVRQMCGVLEAARGAAVTVTYVADSGHHIMLDQPLALADAIRDHVTKTRPAVRDEGDSCYYAHRSYS